MKRIGWTQTYFHKKWLWFSVTSQAVMIVLLVYLIVSVIGLAKIIEYPAVFCHPAAAATPRHDGNYLGPAPICKCDLPCVND